MGKRNNYFENEKIVVIKKAWAGLEFDYSVKVIKQIYIIYGIIKARPRQKYINIKRLWIMNVLVCITPQSNGKRLIDKGAQVVDNDKLHILYMQRGDSLFLSEASASVLEELFDYAKSKGGMVHFISGNHFLSELQKFAGENDIGHFVVGEPPQNIMSKEKLENSIREYIPNAIVTIVENPDYVTENKENSKKFSKGLLNF